MASQLRTFLAEWLLPSVLGFSTVAAVVIGLFWSFAGDLCSNEVTLKRVSPNGKLRAVVFCRDCGATTAFSTQVAILSTEKRLANDGGNVFGADESGSVTLVWKSDDDLVVGYPKGLRVFRQESKVRGVRVHYVAYPE